MAMAENRPSIETDSRFFGGIFNDWFGNNNQCNNCRYIVFTNFYYVKIQKSRESIGIWIFVKINFDQLQASGNLIIEDLFKSPIFNLVQIKTGKTLKIT